MDHVNKLLRNVAERLLASSPAGRLTALLLVATVVGALVVLFRYDIGGSHEDFLMGIDLSVTEITALEAAFADKGLNGSKVEGSRVLIPRGRKSEYIAAAQAAGALPRSARDFLEDSSIAGSPFLSLGTEQRRERMDQAYDLMLADYIISKINGIEEAIVRSDQAAEGRFPKKVKKSALVGVRALDGRSLTQQQVRTIRDTVVGYYVGMEPDSVTVTDLNAFKAYRGAGIDESDASVYLMHKEMFERLWRDKILDRLSMYDGVVVGVEVELDKMLEERREQTKFEAVNVESEEVRVITGDRRDRSVRLADDERIVGNQGRTITEPTPVARREEITNRTRSVPARTSITSGHAGLTPTSVRASVAVPDDLFASIWRKRNGITAASDQRQPSRAELLAIEQETVKSIEDSILPLLPPADVTDELPLLTVTGFERGLGTPRQPLPAAVVRPPDGWLAENWRAGAMIAVASLVVLLVLLRAVPGRTSEPSRSAVAGTSGSPRAAQSAGDAESENVVRSRFRESKPNLRAQLTDLVREDPDSAASVLRNWIGDAA